MNKINKNIEITDDSTISPNNTFSDNSDPMSVSQVGRTTIQTSRYVAPETKQQQSLLKFRPIIALLLDDSLEFSQAQKEVLAVAHALHMHGFEPHIISPSSSLLAKHALILGIKHIPLQEFEQGYISKSKTAFQLFWKYRRCATLCLHTFSDTCLTMAQKIVQIRRKGSTFLIHSCYTRLADYQKTSNSATLAPYWNNLQKIIYSSAYEVSAWASFGIEPSLAQHIHPAFDCVNFYKEERKQRFIFVVASDLCEGSGLDFLFQSMAELKASPKLPTWEVRIIGTGEKFNEYLEQAKELQVIDKLALLGKQEFADIFEQADVVILPHSDKHGNIAALMAAWCMGLPTIATRNVEHMEIAYNGNALLIPEKNADALTKAMTTLMLEKDRRLYFAKASEQMRDYAHIARFEEKYMELYRDCVARLGWVLSHTPQ